MIKKKKKKKKKAKGGGESKSSWKIIQYNDSESDPKYWKQSGVTHKNTIDMNWEDAKMVNNHLEKNNNSILINAILRLKTFWKESRVE